MTQMELPLPKTADLSKQQFAKFYSDLYAKTGYLGTLVFQCAHLHMLLVHLLPGGGDASKTSLGTLLDIASEQKLLSAPQLKQCRTLLELQLYHTSRSLLSLNMDAGKGVYYFGKMSDILFELSKKI